MFQTERNVQFQCSLKFSAHINMFQQHYLGNKKPTFLACNTEQVHAAILESSKINDLLQNRQIYFRLQGKGVRIYFCENSPGIFHFFTLPLEIPDKTKLNPWIFHKIVLDPLEIPRPKTKTPRNFTFSLFFLGHPWKFHFVFN